MGGPPAVCVMISDGRLKISIHFPTAHCMACIAWQTLNSHQPPLTPTPGSRVPVPEWRVNDHTEAGMITPKEPVKNPTVRCKVCKGACVITSFMCIDCDLKRRREFKAKHQQPRPSVFRMDLKLYFHEWMLRLRDASRRKRAQTFRLRVAPFPLHMLNTFAQWIYSMDPLSPSVPTQTRGCANTPCQRSGCTT